MFSSLKFFWLTINMLFFMHYIFAAPFDPYEFEPEQIYRRSLINNLISPLPDYNIVAIVNKGEQNNEINLNNQNGKQTKHEKSSVNRRSVHPCRWKLCGAYANYNTLG
ncbi:hypothetical protein Mgra_00008471 [Meloidogyne graminicola]|uniref:Uncharacterized protein n=1 Tax=Meloidogyne graminicola TaxID=189291 RepID=A0A8S9ZFK5_9BILA|nr:hypothetical protein Mgra_00008471 [Meloidogyne graminicola]